jgi:hypothetical protein
MIYLMHPAAEQRSELSPGRGFREPWVRLIRLAEPRSGDSELVNKVRLIIGVTVAPPGLDTFFRVDPRLAEPALGLTLTAAPQLGRQVYESRFIGGFASRS